MKLHFQLHGIIKARRGWGSSYGADSKWYIITDTKTQVMRMTKYKQILKKL